MTLYTPVTSDDLYIGDIFRSKYKQYFWENKHRLVTPTSLYSILYCFMIRLNVNLQIKS